MMMRQIADSSRRRKAITGAAAATFAVIAIIVWRCQSAVLPVLKPDDSLSLDASVAMLVRDQIDRTSRVPRDPAQRLRLAQMYHANELYDLATATYEQALALCRDDARAWYLLGLCERELGHHESALRAFTEAAERSDNSCLARWRLGMMLLECGALDESQKEFRRATTDCPDDEYGWIGFARAQIAMGHQKQALASLHQAQRVAVHDRAYIEHLLRRMSRERDSAPDVDVLPVWFDPWFAELMQFRVSFGWRVKVAADLIRRHQFVNAVMMLETLHAEQPNDVTVLGNLGIAYAETGRFDEAVQTLGRAIELDPNRSAPHENLARALLAKSIPQPPATAHRTRSTALNAVDRAILLNPDAVSAHAVRGDLLFRDGRHAEAAAAYEAAARISDQSGAWRHAAARMYAETAQWTLAASLLEQSLAADPHNAAAHHDLGVALMNLNRREQAAAHLHEALRLDPGNPLTQQALDRLIGSSNGGTTVSAVRGWHAHRRGRLCHH